MFDIITFGSAVRDAFFYSKNFKISKDDGSITGSSICFDLGSKIEVDNVIFEIGGGSVNNSVSFSKLGMKSACVAQVGNDVAGGEILKRLEEEGVGTSFILKSEELNTAYSVIISTRKEGRTILVYRGASKNIPPAQISWQKLKSKWYYISSLTGNFSLLKKIFEKARKDNIKIAFNPGSSELKEPGKLKPFLKKTDILFLNQEEASIMTGKSFGKPREILSELNNLTSGISVMTRGKRGVMVIGGDGIYKAGILRGKVVERTGAGDAFGSGFTAGIMEKGDISYAIQLGTANSTYVIKEIGATRGLLSRRNLRKIQKVKVNIK